MVLVHVPVHGYVYHINIILVHHVYKKLGGMPDKLYVYSLMMRANKLETVLVFSCWKIHSIHAGFYLEILFGGGNMVDKDSKKGHNPSMYSRGICYKPALALNTHTPYLECY